MDFESIIFAQSARRHRIGRVRALYLIRSEEPKVINHEIIGESRLLWVGLDDRGLDIEIIGILNGDELLVIHVMPLFRKRGRRYEEQ